MDDTPTYVLRALDAMAVTKAGMGAAVKVKTAVWILLGCVALVSLVTRENVFRDLPGTAKLMLALLTAWTLFFNTDELAPVPIELRFYDDRLVVYHERRAYSPRNVRREIQTILYQDVRECQYRPKRSRVNIIGRFEDTYYFFGADGSLPERPSQQRTLNSAIMFHTGFSPEVDFVREIESHSPLKVSVTD